jgi:hypothetical protein
MKRLLTRLGVALVLLLIVLFVGDTLSVRYRLPGNREPFGTVEVETYYAVLKKDGKTEYILGNTENQTCVRSLFPHYGYSPCWYASRNKVKQVDI